MTRKMEFEQEFYHGSSRVVLGYEGHDVLIRRRLEVEDDGSHLIASVPERVLLKVKGQTVLTLRENEAFHLGSAIREAGLVVTGERAWTIFGHWENGEIVMDAVAEGVHQDVREADDERWPEGLWCDSGMGGSWQDVFATLRGDYEPCAVCGEDHADDEGCLDVCNACGRESLACSQDPCKAVIADREA